MKLVWPILGLFGLKRSEKHERAMSKREETRPKADLNWTLSGDALRPKEAPHGFIGQNPVEFNLAPNQGRIVNLGISANVPLLVFPTRAHADDVLPPEGSGQWPRVIPPGTDIVVVVKNSSAHVPMHIDDKESLVCIHPLLWSGTTDVA